MVSPTCAREPGGGRGAEGGGGLPGGGGERGGPKGYRAQAIS